MNPRRRLLAAVGLIAALLVGAGAYYVVHRSAAERRDVRRDFERRAQLAARLTASALSSGTQAFQLASYFGGPAKSLPAGLAGYESGATDPAAAVIDARGRVLAAWPRGAAGAARAAHLSRLPETRSALQGETRISDLVTPGEGAGQHVVIAVPIATRYGRRVVVDSADAGQVDSFAAGYLASAPGIAGSRAYLLDGAERVLSSTLHLPQGRALPEPALRGALASAGNGPVGRDYYATAPLSGTPWHIVFVVDRGLLFAAANNAAIDAWRLFGAFVAALLALLVAGSAALRRSAELAGAREREEAARLRAHERLHDRLTGLPNRALFLDRVEQALATSDAAGTVTAVLLVDLDAFGAINDALGHSRGDELLVRVAARLSAAASPADTVSRLGGDQFLVLCTDLPHAGAAVDAATRFAAALERPFFLIDRSIYMTCGIGIATPDAVRQDAAAETLIRDADAALHQAKARGRREIQVSGRGLHTRLMERLETEVALRRGIGAGELRLAFQPIVGLPDRELHGVEALVRWQRPGHGLVAPLEFIALAEECGLIDELGEWVLDAALAHVAEWEAAELLGPGFTVSVNVSPRQLVGVRLIPHVRRTLDRTGVAPHRLCLEITESAVAADPQLARATLGQLAALGVQLAIDDFGVGRSSLVEIARSLPIDMLKLDRSFVAGMASPRERAVAAAIAPLARSLEMAAVAEGVETEEEASELAALGYRLGQGYLFGRPGEADDIRMLLGAASAPHTGTTAGLGSATARA